MTEPALTKPHPDDFLGRVEFREAALLSFVTSAIIVPAYDRVKRDFGISRAEYMLLLCLSHYPVLTAQDVSRLTGRPRNSISRAVHRMLAEGYIDRVPAPNDARQARLTITSRGRSLHTKVVEVMTAREAEVLQVLSDADRRALERILTSVSRHAAGLSD